MLALLLLCWSTAAAADSWGPPQQTIYLSPNRQVRLIVTPNHALARYYLEGPASAPRPSGQAQGRLQRRGADGRWRTEWDVPLVNDVSPVSALVANSGGFVVTFDDWAGIGVGDNVVAIYGPAGRLIRALRLDAFLPLDYIMTLPRTFGSVWWGGFAESGHAIAPGGDRLVLQVSMPGTDLLASGFVELSVDLATGRPAPLVGPAWERAFAAAAPIRAAQREREAREAEFLRAPLVGPASGEEGEWHRYLFEAFNRLDPAWQDAVPSIGVLILEPADEVSRIASHSSVRAPLWNPHDDDDVLLFGSPDVARLADMISAALQDPRVVDISGHRVYIVADDAHWPRFVEIFAGTGARLIQLDPSEPIPQRPERLPPAA